MPRASLPSALSPCPSIGMTTMKQQTTVVVPGRPKGVPLDVFESASQSHKLQHSDHPAVGIQVFGEQHDPADTGYSPGETAARVRRVLNLRREADKNVMPVGKPQLLIPLARPPSAATLRRRLGQDRDHGTARGPGSGDEQRKTCAGFWAAWWVGLACVKFRRCLKRLTRHQQSLREAQRNERRPRLNAAIEAMHERGCRREAQYISEQVWNIAKRSAWVAKAASHGDYRLRQESTPLPTIPRNSKVLNQGQLQPSPAASSKAKRPAGWAASPTTVASATADAESASGSVPPPCITASGPDQIDSPASASPASSAASPALRREEELMLDRGRRELLEARELWLELVAGWAAETETPTTGRTGWSALQGRDSAAGGSTPSRGYRRRITDRQLAIMLQGRRDSDGRSSPRASPRVRSPRRQRAGAAKGEHSAQAPQLPQIPPPGGAAEDPAAPEHLRARQSRSKQGAATDSVQVPPLQTPVCGSVSPVPVPPHGRPDGRAPQRRAVAGEWILAQHDRLKAADERRLRSSRHKAAAMSGQPAPGRQKHRHHSRGSSSDDHPGDAERRSSQRTSRSHSMASPVSEQVTGAGDASPAAGLAAQLQEWDWTKTREELAAVSKVQSRVPVYLRQAKATKVKTKLFVHTNLPHQKGLLHHVDSKEQFRAFLHAVREERGEFNQRVNREIERVERERRSVFDRKVKCLMNCDCLRTPLNECLRATRETIHQEIDQHQRQHKSSAHVDWFNSLRRKFLSVPGAADDPRLPPLFEMIRWYFTRGRLAPDSFERLVSNIDACVLYSDDVQFVLENVACAFHVERAEFKALLRRLHVHYRLTEDLVSRTMSTQDAAFAIRSRMAEEMVALQLSMQHKFRMEEDAITKRIAHERREEARRALRRATTRAGANTNAAGKKAPRRKQGAEGAQPPAKAPTRWLGKQPQGSTPAAPGGSGGDPPLLPQPPTDPPAGGERVGRGKALAVQDPSTMDAPPDAAAAEGGVSPRGIAALRWAARKVFPGPQQSTAGTSGSATPEAAAVESTQAAGRMTPVPPPAPPAPLAMVG
eukprot:TRINITY_DN22960_c0_g1_i1.p1 TRINITY_DN22960_c0_g1~~TRINITY_DN22960_c0_g1_i1.p1  ORF type:complete len:1109 (+),score=293.91 TRINITY_DN22960_c0_g1_i1:173-3328(+)